MRVVTAVVASTVSVLALAACTSWVVAPACADPPLVTTTYRDDVSGDTAVSLWQPDGRHTALTSGRTGGGAVISPDGLSVAFPAPEGEYSDTNGYSKSRVAVQSTETRDVALVSSDIPDSTVGYLQWSPDGSEVAFVRRVGEVREIAAVRVEGGAERRLLELNAGQSGQYGWSSDGEELLIPTSLEMLVPLSDPKSELRRYSIGTGDYAVVETPHSFIGQIAWSPDDRFVAMNADIPGTDRWRLFVLDLKTGISTPVDRRRGGPQSLTWSGPFLLYVYDVWTPDDARYLMRWDSISQERGRVDRPGLDTVVGHFGAISAPRCGGWAAGG